MFHTVKHVSGGILWANLHLLFWLSLLPVTTAWAGDSRFAATPTAVYGVVLLMAGVGYYILQNVIIAHQGAGSLLAAAIGRDVKGRISLVLYAMAIPLAFVRPWIANAIYVLVALMWLIPDRRIERVLRDESR